MNADRGKSDIALYGVGAVSGESGAIRFLGMEFRSMILGMKSFFFFLFFCFWTQTPSTLDLKAEN